MKKMYLVLALPFLFAGCMMPGAGGMGLMGHEEMRGSSHAQPMSGQLLIRESVVDGMRIVMREGSRGAHTDWYCRAPF